MTTGNPRGFTGRHMTAILVGFFAVVIAVNVLMANLAVGTFGGVVVENSYVASQHFNRWLGEAATEKKLGWKSQVARQPDGRLLVELAGAPADKVSLTGDARHPLGRAPDVPLTFIRRADGLFVSTRSMPAGRWQLRLEARDGALLWRAQKDLT